MAGPSLARGERILRARSHRHWATRIKRETHTGLELDAFAAAATAATSAEAAAAAAAL